MSNTPFVALQLNDSYKPVTDGVAVCAENYARWLHRSGVPTALAAPWSPEYEDRDEFPVFRYTSIPIPGWHPYRAGLPDIDPAFHVRLRHWLDHLSQIHDLGDLFEPPNEAAGMPVVIHAHAPFASGALGRRLRHRLRRRGRRALLIATLHSKYHEDFSRSLPEPIVDQVIRVVLRHFQAADAVWTPNSGTARTLQEYGFDREITVVPNGSDLPRPDDREYARLRDLGGRLVGLPDSDRVLLFVGQQRWEKNIRLILDALAMLSKRDVQAELPAPWRMVFVGNGPDEDAIRSLAVKLGLASKRARSAGRNSGREGGATRAGGADKGDRDSGDRVHQPGADGGDRGKRADATGASDGARGHRPGDRRRPPGPANSNRDRVIFYGHVLDREELKALYARSDLFVFPSVYDNAPLVVREAAAFCTPSILAENSHAAGDTVHDRNAFHVTPEPEALAALLGRLLAAPETVERVGQAASGEVFRSWEDVVREVRNRYAELVVCD